MCSFNKNSDVSAREVDLGSIANNKPPRFFINKTFLCVVKQIKIVSINLFCVCGVIYFVWLFRGGLATFSNLLSLWDDLSNKYLNNNNTNKKEEEKRRKAKFISVIESQCIKGCGMCYPVCGMVHIKEPLLIIGKSSPCGSSGFPLSLSEWSFTIRPTAYNRN